MNERPSNETREPNREAPSGIFAAAEMTPGEAVDPLIWTRIDTYLARNRAGAEGLIPLLHLAQATLGYLPAAVLEQIAARLGLPLVQVHGVVSFYHFFSTTPPAKYQLKVCMGTACFVRRARALSEAIRQVLGVDVGGVTKDQLFGLEEVRCLGSCGLAPVMTLNGDTHGNLKPGDARKLAFGLQAKARRERIIESVEERDG